MKHEHFTRHQVVFKRAFAGSVCVHLAGLVLMILSMNWLSIFTPSSAVILDIDISMDDPLPILSHKEKLFVGKANSPQGVLAHHQQDKAPTHDHKYTEQDLAAVNIDKSPSRAHENKQPIVTSYSHGVMTQKDKPALNAKEIDQGAEPINHAQSKTQSEDASQQTSLSSQNQKKVVKKVKLLHDSQVQNDQLAVSEEAPIQSKQWDSDRDMKAKLAREEQERQLLMKKAKLANSRKAFLQKQTSEKEQARQLQISLERKGKQEAERLEKIKLEKQRKERARQEQISLERKRKQEAERLEKIKLEKQRKERVRQEQIKLERKRKQEAERLEKIKLENQRKERARQEQIKLELARKEKARLEEVAQQQRLKALQIAQEKARSRAIAIAVNNIKMHIESKINVLPEFTGLVSRLVITLSADGVVKHVRVSESSGHEQYDQHAISTIYKSSPLPMPEDKELASEFSEIRFTFKPTENPMTR